MNHDFDMIFDTSTDNVSILSKLSNTKWLNIQ